MNERDVSIIQTLALADFNLRLFYPSSSPTTLCQPSAATGHAFEYSSCLRIVSYSKSCSRRWPLCSLCYDPRSEALAVGLITSLRFKDRLCSLFNDILHTTQPRDTMTSNSRFVGAISPQFFLERFMSLDISCHYVAGKLRSRFRTLIADKLIGSAIKK